MYPAMIAVNQFNEIFLPREGIFGQNYYSARFYDKEVTIDNIWGDWRVCECAPYKEKLDKKSKVFARGAGEVLREYFFKSFEEARNFVIGGMLK